MASGDETFLESAIETISSNMPYELRRYMEHIKSLDDAATATVKDLQDAENNYIQKMHENALNLQLPEGLIPTTEEMQTLLEGKNCPQILSNFAQY